MHVSRQFDGLYLDRRECLIGLNCNARNNYNANGNDNDSYSLLQKMCARSACMHARVHVHYARVRVRRGYGGIRGAALYMNYS